MPFEVAARTGPLAEKITDAELARHAKNVISALGKYTVLQNMAGSDARTARFIQCRLAELEAEQKLQRGEWIRLQPSGTNDPNWVFSFGQAHPMPDGALEVEFGPKGHMLYSRTRMGMDFEVRGQYELVHSDNTNFQGGIVMGVPDFNGDNWYGFRIRRHRGDSVCLGLGWSLQEISRPFPVSVTNSFGVPENSYLLGLGSFSDSPDTVIRYRNVQARRLD
jgi:hypothetical protein